jgi:hypothetical protein
MNQDIGRKQQETEKGRKKGRKKREKEIKEMNRIGSDLLRKREF